MRRAAEQGQSEIQILRFPSQYCTDHGRAINNFEEGWPKSLTGFALRVHEAYVERLQPQGYKIRAQILNYPDGGLGEVGLVTATLASWRRTVCRGGEGAPPRHG